MLGIQLLRTLYNKKSPSHKPFLVPVASAQPGLLKYHEAIQGDHVALQEALQGPGSDLLIPECRPQVCESVLGVGQLQIHR